MMLYAVDGMKSRRASPGASGRCPFAHELEPICEKLTCWHWRHRAGEACDSWLGQDSEWELRWKSLFPETWVEKPVERNGTWHIPDVVTPGGTIIVFSSNIVLPDEARARNVFYGPKLIWVFDLRRSRKEKRVAFQKQDYGYSFRWYDARRPMWEALKGARAVFWDFGSENLFLVKKVHPDAEVGGWGRVISKNRWLSAVMSV